MQVKFFFERRRGDAGEAEKKIRRQVESENRLNTVCDSL